MIQNLHLRFLAFPAASTSYVNHSAAEYSDKSDFHFSTVDAVTVLTSFELEALIFPCCLGFLFPFVKELDKVADGATVEGVLQLLDLPNIEYIVLYFSGRFRCRRRLRLSTLPANAYSFGFFIITFSARISWRGTNVTNYISTGHAAILCIPFFAKGAQRFIVIRAHSLSIKTTCLSNLFPKLCFLKVQKSPFKNRVN